MEHRRQGNVIGACLMVVAFLGVAGAAAWAMPQPKLVSFSWCGSPTSCSSQALPDLTLELRLNATVVPPTGSLVISVYEYNPTGSVVTLKSEQHWVNDDLLEGYLCYSGQPPVGAAVYKGYYTLKNLSTAGGNLLFVPSLVACVTSRAPAAFSFPPSVPGSVPSQYSGVFQIYAVEGSCLWVGGTCNNVRSLGSASPAVYTVVAGDEWGNLALTHFAVGSLAGEDS